VAVFQVAVLVAVAVVVGKFNQKKKEPALRRLFLFRWFPSANRA
jgi:hypothetical protein